MVSSERVFWLYLTYFLFMNPITLLTFTPHFIVRLQGLKLSSLASWTGSWALGSNPGCDFGTTLLCLAFEENERCWQFQRWKRKKICNCLLIPLKEREGEPFPDWKTQVSWGCEGHGRPDLQMNLLPAVLWLNRRSAQRGGCGHKLGPHGGQTGPGWTLTSVGDGFPRSKGSSLYSGLFCVFCAVVKREKIDSQPRKCFPPFSTQSSPSHSLLTSSPVIPGKPCVFLFPCLVDIFTVGFLCCMCHWPKCQDITINANKLRGNLISPWTWAHEQICFPAQESGQKCVLRDHVWGYHSLLSTMETYEPLVFSHSGTTPNISLTRMSWKLVCRKSCGLWQQTHSCIHVFGDSG